MGSWCYSLLYDYWALSISRRYFAGNIWQGVYTSCINFFLICLSHKTHQGYYCGIDCQRSSGNNWRHEPPTCWFDTKAALQRFFSNFFFWSSYGLHILEGVLYINWLLYVSADPAERITLQAAAEHPWVAGADGPVPEFICRCGFGRRNRNAEVQ